MLKTERKVMVCVTRQRYCERLIKVGYRIAGEVDAGVVVVHVAKTGTNFLDDPDEGKALEYLFQISKEVNADMSVLRSDNVVKTLVKFAKDNNVSIVVMGESPDYHENDNIIKQMERRLPGVEVRQVPAN